MAVIATAGHVDHGKSSLIQALTGTDPDRLAEEKRRGMTIDLGFAHTDTLSFVDVPGHVDFLNTMVAGVHGVDIALLVIDSVEGWKPQTVEHLDILMLMQVRHIVVAFTKADATTPDAIDALATQTQSEFAVRDISLNKVIVTSAHTGAGLDELRTILLTLTNEISATSTTSPPRLFVDRVFTIAGAGTVVTGTLGGAPIHEGDELVVARTQESTKVRGIQQHGSSSNVALPRTRCALNVTHLSTEDIHRGDVLVTENSWHNTEVFDASVEMAFSIRTQTSVTSPLRNGGGYTLHVGTARRAASIRFLNNGTTTMRIRFTGSLPLRPGDRFLLRRTGDDITVAGGSILDVKPVVRTTRANPTGNVASILKHHGWLSVAKATQLVGAPVTAVVEDWVAAPETVQTTTDALLALLQETQEVDIAQLQPWERLLIATLPNVIITHGIATIGTANPLLSHPYVQLFLSSGITTPDTKTLERDVIRRLIHGGILYEHDNIAFHVDTLHNLRPALQNLWQQNPQGFSVSHLREELGITRKHAVPLATCLDKVALTRRVGDVRLPGSTW
jgi:selenocysteine-specific elongation factor